MHRLGVRRREGDRGFAGEQQEGEGFLQIQGDRYVGVGGIADRDVLADMQIEVAAAGGQDKSARNRRCPDDFPVDQTLDMLEHRIAMIAGFAKPV